MPCKFCSNMFYNTIAQGKTGLQDIFINVQISIFKYLFEVLFVNSQK